MSEDMANSTQAQAQAQIRANMQTLGQSPRVSRAKKDSQTNITRLRATSPMNLDSSYNATFHDLHAWYSETLLNVGRFAATQDGQSHKASHHTRIVQGLDHLVQAVNDRLDNVPRMIGSEDYDLRVILMHVNQLKTSMDRLR